MSRRLSPRSTGQVPDRPCRVAVRVACAGVSAVGTGVGAEPSSTWKISWWIRPRSTPRPRRACSAPWTSPKGPQRNQPSMVSTGSSEGRSVASRSRSSLAGRQTRLLFLPGEDGDQLEAVGVAVLQVGDLVEEHRGRGGAVAADQAEPGLGLTGEQGGRDRQDGGDAAAADDGREVAGAGASEKRPIGSMTSTRSPTASSLRAYVEKAPPSTSRMPTRRTGTWPTGVAGAQIEYVRRISSPARRCGAGRGAGRGGAGTSRGARAGPRR